MKIILICLLWAGLGNAGIKSSAGIDLGGNGTMLAGDKSNQAFGMGAGYQGSVFATIWQDKSIGGKIRFETVTLREVSLQKTDASYLSSGSYIRSLGQNWFLLSAGVEGHFQAQGQIWFWEALLGYAMGQDSPVQTTTAKVNENWTSYTQKTSSGFAVSGGFGIRHSFAKFVTGFMSVRTMFLIAPTYSSTELSDKTFIPIPILFSLGAEFPFEFGG